MNKTMMWLLLCVAIGAGAYYLGMRYGSGDKQGSCTLGTAIRQLWHGTDSNRT